jgi:hypothetical protein
MIPFPWQQARGGPVLLVWRGRGILIFLITFCCLFAMDLITRFTFHDPKYYELHGWPKLAGFWIAAALVYALRPWLATGRMHGLFDKDTERDVSVAGTLFYIPVYYWPMMLLALGLLFYFI